MIQDDDEKGVDSVERKLLLERRREESTEIELSEVEGFVHLISLAGWDATGGINCPRI